MKRLIAFFIALIAFAALCLSGCGETSRYQELAGLLDENEKSISETFTEETCDFDMFREYMNSWAKSSGVDVAYSGKHSIALVNPASDGCKDAPSTTLLCNVKTNDIQASLNLIATASTTLMGPEKHGKTTLVITEIKNGRFMGICEIPDKYLSSDNLINLQTSNDNTILTSGPRSADCHFYRFGKEASSKYSKAYKINFIMPEYTDPYDFVKDNNYPNPINVIGGLLASSKSSGKLFDIASFSSKVHDGYTPYSASAIIVMDENNVESFLKKFDSSKESMTEKFEKLEADFVYTCNETDMPETVLSETVSNNLISLMYTLNTGTCLQDEDSGVIYAASYIKKINTKNANLKLDIGLRTRGQSYLDNISEEYKTTAGLCSTKYKCKSNGFVWKSDPESELVTYFTDKVPLPEGDSDISLRTYENDFIYKKNPNQNMIIYAFDSADRKTVLDNIAHFMSTNQEDHR